MCRAAQENTDRRRRLHAAKSKDYDLEANVSHVKIQNSCTEGKVGFRVVRLESGSSGFPTYLQARKPLPATAGKQKSTYVSALLRIIFSLY